MYVTGSSPEHPVALVPCSWAGVYCLRTWTVVPDVTYSDGAPQGSSAGHVLSDVKHHQSFGTHPLGTFRVLSHISLGPSAIWLAVGYLVVQTCGCLT